LLAKFRNAPGYRSQLENVIGSAATATSLITKDGGEIKVDGQIWSARAALPGQIIQPGDDVVVGSIDGVTAIVSTTRQQLY
ncbi:MAG: NfeD family protein, partial [Propionibacteriaceae bacterium]